jgi:hypothetical protein
MRKTLFFTSLSIAFTMQVIAQNVPNGSFENWTSGNPDNWLTNNLTGFAIPVTQATPAYSGSFALKGEVISAFGNPYTPTLLSGAAGFPVTQAYGYLNFYYKQNQVGSAGTSASVGMFQGFGNGVGSGGQMLYGNVTSFTLASIPIYYISMNPDTCIIAFTIGDTSGTDPAVGNYFIIDDVALTGTAGVYDAPPVSPFIIEKVQPNPAREHSFVYYSLSLNSDLQFDLFDATGKKYFELNLPGETAGRHKVEFDASEIPAGFYILRMTSTEGSAHYPLQVLH